MKRSKGMALLLCVLMLTAVLPCGVLAEESDAVTFEYRIVGGEARITGYREKFLASGESYDMVIPGAIEGYPVTRIEQDAFRDCNMRSVTVPDGVRIIGEGAFTKCSMESVVLPDSVTKIGAFAFSACTRLKSIRIPVGVTEICENTFWYCGALTEIVIPEGVTAIGDSAFDNCGALAEIVIPESVTSIGDSAFFRCSSLKSIEISDTVSEMGYCAFHQCDALTDVYCEAEMRPDGWDEKWIVSCENAVVRWDSDGSIPLLAFGLVGGLAVFAIAFLILAAVIVLVVVLVKKRK